MESKQRDDLKRRLIKERERLLGQVDFINRQGLNVEMGESIGELSAYDNHPADIGSEVFERSKDTALRENARLSLAQVERALEKLALGTYGRCDRCGGEIEHRRLAVHPQATLCLLCQQAEEKSTNKEDRPVEEEVLGPPFAGTSWDGAGHLAYAGEDTWREVARYNKINGQEPDAGPDNGGEEAGWEGEEDLNVEDVDSVPYELGKDGIFYWDLSGPDGGGPPRGR